MAMMSRRAVLAALAASGAAPGHAALPDGPVRLVVPAPPGAFNDAFARLLADRLAPALGQPCVVDNRPGAGGMIGTREVMQARPDGRTLGLGNTATLAVNPTVFAAQNFDPLRELAPIARCARIMTVLCAAPSLGVSTLAGLIAAAKARPGVINYGNPGVGSSPHLMFERLKLAAGIDMTGVPYRGSAPVVTALLAGEVPLAFEGVGTMLQHIRAGTVKPLAVSAGERHPDLPQVPTLAEAGVAGLDMAIWFGVVAPAGVQAAMQADLSRAVLGVLGTPDAAAQIARLGGDPWPGDAPTFAALIQDEQARWGAAVRAAGVTPG
jgi:tripartite-type tricarboxylate transporter receptor subunit TctC